MAQVLIHIRGIIGVRRLVVIWLLKLVARRGPSWTPIRQLLLLRYRLLPPGGSHFILSFTPGRGSFFLYLIIWVVTIVFCAFLCLFVRIKVI